LLVAARVPLLTGALLASMAISAAASLLGLPYGGTLSTAVQDTSFAVIGADIGLRFTPAPLRAARSALPAALALLLLVMTGCFVLGAALAHVTGASPLAGYLATTPGGLYVVLATAASTHTDVAFVVTARC